MGRATISDVARAASVSVSTASVVFSGKTPVSDATRQRVLDAAAVLGYSGPDPLAASLRRGRVGVIGVRFAQQMSTAFRDPVIRLTVDAIAERAQEEGSGLLLLTGSSEASLRAAVDAVVVLIPNDVLRDDVRAFRARGVPVAVIEDGVDEGAAHILLDNRGAQREAAQHLADLGHRRVATLTLPFDAVGARGPVDAGTAPEIAVTRDRLAGIREVFPDTTVYRSSTSSIDEGIICARDMFDAAERAGILPTAIIAHSDLLAVGVIAAAEERGIRVPEDLSVTGFDGIPIDGFAPHRLTTLVQPAYEKGRVAGDAVRSMLAGGPAETTLLQCEFRVGTTSAAPRG